MAIESCLLGSCKVIKRKFHPYASRQCDMYRGENSRLFCFLYNLSCNVLFTQVAKQLDILANRGADRSSDFALDVLSKYFIFWKM